MARAREGEAVLGCVRLSRCALIGVIEDPQQSLRMTFVEGRFPVVRRRTAGGSLSLDPDSLVLVLAVPAACIPAAPAVDCLRAFCAPLVDLIGAWGVAGQFTAPNDITERGRKIASAFVLQTPDVVLFEAVLPLVLDIEGLLKTMRLPLEKLSEQGLLAARQRFAPLKSLLPDLDAGALPAAMAAAIAHFLGASPAAERPPEPKTRERLAPATSTPAPDVSAFLKTPAGVLYLDVWLEGEALIRAARFAGGIVCAKPAALSDLAAALIGADIRKAGPTLADAVVQAAGDLADFDPVDLAYLGDLCATRFHIGARLGVQAARALTIFSPDRRLTMEGLLAGIGAVLLPYCAKPLWCKWRHRDGCPECGRCEIGEAYALARARGLTVVTITAYEHLRAVLADLRQAKVKAFAGVCCTDFFIKRDYAFIEAGIAAILIDIAGDTCYTLRAEEAAYAGRFDAEARLDARLLASVLRWSDAVRPGGATRDLPDRAVTRARKRPKV